jgi:hypothetical protein
LAYNLIKKMRISELISEQQTIGAVGSSATPTGQSVPSTGQPPTSPDDQQQANPDQEKMAKLLMPHGIKDPADLNNATAALQVAMQNPNQLKPDQQELLGKLVNPMMKNQGFATALKQLSMQKPGQPERQKPPTLPGQTPPAPGTV